MKLKPYPKYKDSRIEWIGEIPEEWEVRRLKHILNLKSGDSTKDLEEGEYNIYGANGIIGKCNKYKFHKRNILIGRVGASGNIVEAKGKYWVSDNVLIVILNKNNDYQFIKYKLSSLNISDLANKNAQPLITATQIKNIITQIPKNLQIQTAIASFLDKKTSQLNKLIEKNQKLIELLKEKRTALINHAVTKGLDPNAKMRDSGIEWIGEIPEGWEVRCINRLSTVRRGASPRPIDDPKYFDDAGEYSWVRISDVTASNRYLEHTTEKLSVLGKSLSVPLEYGELFISIAGTVGKPIITKIKCCIHDGFVYFQNLKMNQEYLYYIFIGGQVYQGLGKLGTQLNLNTEIIGSITIPLPPKSEQIQIVQYLDKATEKIDKTIKLIENKINLLEEYKKSLIHHVVTGKVDVRSIEA